MTGLMAADVDCWIGLDDIKADTVFTLVEDGSRLRSYTDWYGSNPASRVVQNCLVKKSAQSGQWNVVSCGKSLNFACSMVATESCDATTTAAKNGQTSESWGDAKCFL